MPAKRRGLTINIDFLKLLFPVALAGLAAYGSYYASTATFELRMKTAEKWMDEHRTLDSDITEIRTTLGAIKDRLGDLNATMGKIGDRVSRSLPGNSSP